MHESQNTISPDHQDILADQFNHITYLIHNYQLDNAAEALLNLHHADLADFLDNANRRIYHVILPSIVDKLNPETIACLSDGNKQRVIEALGVTKSAKLIDQLDIEDSIEVIDALADELKQVIIAKLKADKRQHILEGLKYPEILLVVFWRRILFHFSSIGRQDRRLILSVAVSLNQIFMLQ